MERQLDAGGVESRELDRPGESHRGTVGTAGGERARAGVEAHRTRSRLSDGADEPEAAADQRDLAAGAERIGRPGVRYGGELEVATGDGDISAEGIGAGEADDAVRLTPAPEVVVDREGRAGATGDRARQGDEAFGAARGGDAGSAAEGDIAGEREHRIFAVGQVGTQGGAATQAHRTGERDRQRVGGARGDVVDVEFGDRGRGQRQAVRGSPSLAVLSLPGDLTQVHLYRASAEGVGARRDDGTTGDQHPARPGGIVAVEAEVADDLVAAGLGRGGRIEREAAGTGERSEEGDLTGRRDRRTGVGVAQVDDGIGRDRDRSGVDLVGARGRERAARELDRRRNRQRRGVGGIVGAAGSDDDLHEITVLFPAQGPRIGLHERAGRDRERGRARRVELGGGETGERQSAVTGLRQRSRAGQGAGEIEISRRVGDRPGLRGAQLHRGGDDDGGGSAGLERDAGRRGSREEVESAAAVGQRDRARRDAGGRARREGERADAERAVEVGGDRGSRGGVALDAHRAALARQDRGSRRTGEVRGPAGEAGGPIRTAGALPVDITRDERARGERDETVGGRECQRGEAARGRAQQPVGGAKGAGREPAVRG